MRMCDAYREPESSTSPPGSSRLQQVQLAPNKVEASCQADLPPDHLITSGNSPKNRQLGNSSLIVCYDSDDETMLKQRDKRSGRSSSKGRKHRTGAYSKEDIRDQYCINQKELQAFEEFSKNKLWGCLSTGNLLNLNFASNLAHHQPPYLISGVGQAQRVQSKDANRTIARYADISDSETSSDYGCRNNALSLFTCMRKVRIPKHYQRPLDPKLLQQQSDDDFGFKRLPVRPPRTCTIKMNPNKTASSISVMMENQAPPQFPQPFPTAYRMHQTSIPASVNLADYQSVLQASNNPIAFLQNQLNNFANKTYASTSKSADELNDLDSDQQAGNKTKHVSFEIVRSNTISANLAQQVFNMQQQQANPLNERLIQADVAQMPIRTSLITDGGLPQLPPKSLPPQPYAIQQPSVSQLSQINPYTHISLIPSSAANAYVQLQQQAVVPGDAALSSAQLAHHLLAQQQQQQQQIPHSVSQPIVPPQPPVRAMHKKVTMKTQSTQTENSIFYSSHQSRSRSSSRSRYRDLLADGNLLLDDGYLVESLEPSEYDYPIAVDQQQQQQKVRRSSFDLPDYLTLSPRSSSRHRSKRKQLIKDFPSSKKASKAHQLLLNYQKIQNQLEDSDDPLDELSILSKLSHLDREQRALKSGAGYKSAHHHATPVANITKSLLQNVKLSQQQQQLAEANKQFHKNRAKLYRKSLGDVDLGLLSFEHDLSEPILPVHELNKTNLVLSKQISKSKSNSADLTDGGLTADLRASDRKSVHKYEAEEKYDEKYLEKLSLNLSPPEAFQDKVLGIGKQEATQKEERTATKEAAKEAAEKEETIENEIETAKLDKFDEIPAATKEEEKLPVPTSDQEQEERTSTPNEESSIKQTTVIDQYSKSLSEKSSTSVSLAENLPAVESGKEEKSAEESQLKEIEAKEEIEKRKEPEKGPLLEREDLIKQDELLEKEALLEREILKKELLKRDELNQACLENELIKQLSEGLEDERLAESTELAVEELAVEESASPNLINEEPTGETTPERQEEKLYQSQRIQKQEFSIESLLTQQLTERMSNEGATEPGTKLKLDTKKEPLEEVSEDEELEDEQESNENDANLVKVVDLTGGVYLRRNQSSELSTVSEVSEEISLGLNDETYSLKRSKRSSSSSSSKSGSKQKEAQMIKDEKSDKSDESLHTESSTTSNDVNVEELNDEDNSTSKLSDRQAGKKSKSSTLSSSSSSTTSFENLPIVDRDEEQGEEEKSDKEKTDKEKSDKDSIKDEELNLSKSLSQELSNELNRKLEDLQLQSYEQEPKAMAVSTPPAEVVEPTKQQSNLAQLKKCLDSEEFDPRIYRTFSVSIEEPFVNLERLEDAPKGEASAGAKEEQIEDSESNFSTVFGQTISLDKEVSSKETSLSEKSCHVSSKSSSKSSKSGKSAKSSSSSSSSTKLSSKSKSSSSSSTTSATSSKSSKTHSGSSKSDASKKKLKTPSSPSQTSQTGTNEYKLLSGDTENTMDNCSKCAAELAAFKQQHQPVLINLVKEQQQLALKKQAEEKAAKVAEINNLLKPKPSGVLNFQAAGGLAAEAGQIEGVSNDALAVLNLNVETAGDTSQATEQDVANFSFGQQSSQDLADEDSLCLIQSIHASQPTTSSATANENNKLSSKSSHSLRNQKLITKKQQQQSTSSSGVLEKRRQLEGTVAANQSTTSSSSLRNGANQLLPQSELKTIESEECLKEEKTPTTEGNLEAIEKYAAFDESSSVSQISLPETGGTSRVRNLLQRFEQRPVSFAGEPIELGRKERRRSSQSSGKTTIFAKQFGPKSQSIDLIVDDSLIGTHISLSSGSVTKQETEQQSTDEQIKEQTLDDEPSPPIEEPPPRKLSKKSSTGSAKSDRSSRSSKSSKSSKSSRSSSKASKTSSKSSRKEQEEEVLIRKKSDDESSSLSSIEKQKSIGDESISELISEVSSTGIQREADAKRKTEEESSVTLSSTSTKTTKESSEMERKKALPETESKTTLSNESSNLLKDSEVLVEKLIAETDVEIEQQLQEQQTTATSSSLTSGTIGATTTGDTTDGTSTVTTDYSELKIRQHDEALRQNQQLLQQQHSIKRKLLTQLSTSGLALKTVEQDELEKTVEKAARMSSSQDDVLSISGEEEKMEQLASEKATVSASAVGKADETKPTKDQQQQQRKSSTDDNLKSSVRSKAKKETEIRKISALKTELPVYPLGGKQLPSTSKLAKVNALAIDELDEDIGIHSQPYTSGSWFFVTHEDELGVWGHKLEARKEQTTLAGPDERRLTDGAAPSRQSAKLDKEAAQDSQDLSTSFADDEERHEEEQLVSLAESEKSFRRHFQSITHRMIHRRASMELYKRIMNNTFAIDKNVTVSRVNNEFGFRIHGSKPVVISAIEKDTAAEQCNLEIGDIIVTINDVNVLDFNHSDVVRLAHSGCLSLRLGLLNTSKVIRRILSSTSSSAVSTTEQTLTVTTTCESQTTSCITVSNGDQPSSKHRETSQSNECLSDEDDHTTTSCKTVTCSSSILTSSLDYNTASKVLLTGYLRKARASDEDYHKIEADKWRLRLFKLRIDGTLHWFQYPNQTVDPLGIISLKGTYCKLLNIDHLPRPIEQRAEPETKMIIFAIVRNKTDKMLHYFRCKALENAQKWINMLNLIAKQVSSTNLYIERTLKYTHTSPMYIRNPDCQGYLGKKSEKTGNYRQRFFILKDGCLYFYLEIASNITIGVFYLHGYKVQSSSDRGIQLVPTNPQHKLIELRSDTEIDKKRWLSAFEYSIDRWIKLA